MKSIRFPKQFRVYAPLIAVFLVLVFVFPKTAKFTYDYKKGSPWMSEDLVAQFDFPVLKSDFQIQQERDKASEQVIPYYRQNLSVLQQVEKELADIDLDSYPGIRGELAAMLSKIYDKGVISLQADNPSLSSDSQSLVYVQRGKRAERTPVSEIHTVESARQQLKDFVETSFSEALSDTLFNLNTVYMLIRPNLVFDKQTTELVHDNTVDYISPTQGVVKAGHIIISKGEIVTAEVEQMLESYKNEYDKNIGYYGSGVYQWVSRILIALALVVVLFLAIYYCNSRIFEQLNRYLYLLMIFTLSSVAAALMSDYSTAFYYMVPFTLVSLYLLAFFKQRVVFTVYVISLIPLLLFAPNGIEVFVIYLVAGVVGMLVFEYFNRGWLQFVTAFIVFIVMALVWLSFRLAEGIDTLSEFPMIMYMAFGAFLSVAGYPLIYLFEKIFKLVSKSKLIDLSDTGNPLLRQLAEKAPGTFQHCLQVMNLADAAARAIDANVPLVRAGALYHDIGKTINPICFTENEAHGVKYHDGLTYKESAQEIIAHVSRGVALAEKYGLPSVIKDFILTHHGTSCTGYFYNKYLNEGGDPAEVSEFFYDGSKPVTKEQVILMLCDGVEAASRSLKDYSAESISALVEKIVGSKIEDGQLSEAEISLSELNVIKAVMKNHIQQIYHVRVAYPKRETKA